MPVYEQRELVYSDGNASSTSPPSTDSEVESSKSPLLAPEAEQRESGTDAIPAARPQATKLEKDMRVLFTPIGEAQRVKGFTVEYDLKTKMWKCVFFRLQRQVFQWIRESAITAMNQGERCKGTLIKWCNERLFGFIAPDNDAGTVGLSCVYFSKDFSTEKEDEGPTAGWRVEFDIEHTTRGYRGRNVKRIHDKVASTEDSERLMSLIKGNVLFFPDPDFYGDDDASDGINDEVQSQPDDDDESNLDALASMEQSSDQYGNDYNAGNARGRFPGNNPNYPHPGTPNYTGTSKRNKKFRKKNTVHITEGMKLINIPISSFNREYRKSQQSRPAQRDGGQNMRTPRRNRVNSVKAHNPYAASKPNQNLPYAYQMQAQAVDQHVNSTSPATSRMSYVANTHGGQGRQQFQYIAAQYGNMYQKPLQQAPVYYVPQGVHMDSTGQRYMVQQQRGVYLQNPHFAAQYSPIVAPTDPNSTASACPPGSPYHQHSFVPMAVEVMSPQMSHAAVIPTTPHCYAQPELYTFATPTNVSPTVHAQDHQYNKGSTSPYTQPQSPQMSGSESQGADVQAAASVPVMDSAIQGQPASPIQISPQPQSAAPSEM